MTISDGTVLNGSFQTAVQRQESSVPATTKVLEKATVDDIAGFQSYTIRCLYRVYTGGARHGTARHGTARHGTARHGTARYGPARHWHAFTQERRICAGPV